MKKNLVWALLSLVAIVGVAIADSVGPKPVVYTTPNTTQGVNVNEEFLFTIYYQYTEELLVSNPIDGVDDSWLWWWERNDKEVRTLDYVGVIETYNTTVTYTIRAINRFDESNAYLTYMTGDEPPYLK